MRKAVATILSGFYLLVTVGLAVNIHYCSGEIASVQLYAEPASCCDGAVVCQSACCHDVTQIIRFEEQQSFYTGFRLNLELPVTELVAGVRLPSPDFMVIRSIRPGDDALFPPPKAPAWLLNCSLIYYA
ncbi:HYC_CC_PP family protein [Gaoshiqia sp. Z1-71]|uniref:HYC_CC_PP family protein n=1 Tax=Gaoshiqia hydrogeniformans TaxID=3290090 RepID=UPI003BF7C811